MPKLYLVGITEDRTGLVLARSPQAKSGESVLEVDGDLLEAIAEIRRYRASGGVVPSVSSPALPSRRGLGDDAGSTSRLSPREIQALIRRGESIRSVARKAGVDEWRIDIYAAPIVAEQARIVARARELTLEKRGAGPSGRPLGDAVLTNVVEKRVSMDAQQFEAAWSACEPEPDRWIVRFSYVSRGRDQVAEWVYDPVEESISAGNRLGTTLGWRDPDRPGRVPRLPEAPTPEPDEGGGSGSTSKRARARKQGSRRSRSTSKAASKSKSKSTSKSKSKAKPSSKSKPASKAKPTSKSKPSASKRPSSSGRRSSAKTPSGRRERAKDPSRKQPSTSSSTRRKSASRSRSTKSGGSKSSSSRRGRRSSDRDERPPGAPGRLPDRFSQPTRRLTIVEDREPPEAEAEGETVGSTWREELDREAPRASWREEIERRSRDDGAARSGRTGVEVEGERVGDSTRRRRPLRAR